MLVNLEWQSFAIKKKAFRVTSPVGLQRSTYFISLPARYTAPLIIVFAVLHWALSQSVFLVYLHGVYEGGQQSGVFPMVGFSALPTITCE
jgi:hypothetical protein